MCRLNCYVTNGLRRKVISYLSINCEKPFPWLWAGCGREFAIFSFFKTMKVGGGRSMGTYKCTKLTYCRLDQRLKSTLVDWRGPLPPVRSLMVAFSAHLAEHKVPGFLSSRPNWAPYPLTHKRELFRSLWVLGETHSLAGDLIPMKRQTLHGIL